MNTLDNPGSFTPYHLKSIRMITSSVLSKFKSGEFIKAFNFLVTESLNSWNKKKILNKKGKYYCPLCENHSGSFIHMSNSFRYSFNSVCPYCSSRARHRGLLFLYKKEISGLDTESRVLHFAPEPVFYSIFKNKSFRYQTTDYILEDVDLPKQDVQNLSIADDMYDRILSNHVIEHVQDDIKALSEMYRITKKGGKVIITVPGNFKRARTVYFENLKNNGHYRDYGIDFIKKLEKVFNKVEIIDLNSFDTTGELAIPKRELVFIGIKL
ncbi:MAG: class I SAM-dependent methyltransferase [Bacteroidota bacterium]|nr:class I SAM-dependent methyltransferase [Bacteroidota bacterium]